MALDSTIGSPTANSYVTQIEADTYFADQLHRDLWDLYTNKDQALISATSYIDTYASWTGGTKTTTTQALDWPRKGMLDCDGTAIANDIIPTAIKVAVFEMAYSILEVDPSAPNKMAGYKQVEVGSLNVVADNTTLPNSPIPDSIWRILGCLASNPNTDIINIWRC